MLVGKKAKRSFARFLKDTAGSMAMAWGVIGVAVVVTVGSAYDINQVSKAKQIAQLAADNMALTASIAVDKDNDDRYVEGEAYSYEQLGGPENDFTDSMVGQVTYDVADTQDQSTNDDGTLKYDENGDPVYEKLIAQATVSGTYKPAFMGVFGVDSIPFEATSDVAYADTAGSPASIFFAVDNSGSMDWDDNNGVQKLSGLEASLVSFMNTLDAINTDNSNVFRTALYPYSADYDGWYNYISDDGIVTNKDVPPQWGKLSNGDINGMTIQYGTDSSGAMEEVATKMSLEDAIHQAENNEEPLKYVVFMSDGSNNQSYECGTQQVWVPDTEEYWVDTWGGWNTVYYSEQWWFDSWVIHYPASETGHYEDQQTCSWDYWSDIETKASCDSIKAAGATIYTVGYDLNEGYQYKNGSRVSSGWSWLWVYASEVTRAQSLLSYCATDSDHYILAEDASDLNAVFTEIGEEIVKEVIRVKR